MMIAKRPNKTNNRYVRRNGFTFKIRSNLRLSALAPGCTQGISELGTWKGDCNTFTCVRIV